MRFLKRKIFYKFILISIIPGVTTVTSYLILRHFKVASVSIHVVLIESLLLIAIYLSSLSYFITHPLKIVLKQIKALLTGREYKRILTDKTDEIGIIAHFFNEITRSFERASKDIKEQRRMSAELDIANKIQNSILPQTAPEIPELTIIAKTKPAVEIGGDSFDFITSKNNTFMYIGDVTGHGVPSGLVMMMVNTLITTFADMYENARDIIIQTNKHLKPLLRSIMYMTAVILRWDTDTKKMYYSGAGHEHIIVYKNKTGKCELNKTGGLALGMIEETAKFTEEKELDFNPGDCIILFTDGITESKNSAGEMYGLKTLIKTIENSGINATTEELLSNITYSLNKFTEEQIQEDDMSIVLIKNKVEILSKENKNSIKWEVGGGSLLLN